MIYRTIIVDNNYYDQKIINYLNHRLIEYQIKVYQYNNQLLARADIKYSTSFVIDCIGEAYIDL